MPEPLLIFLKKRVEALFCIYIGRKRKKSRPLPGRLFLMGDCYRLIKQPGQPAKDSGYFFFA